MYTDPTYRVLGSSLWCCSPVCQVGLLLIIFFKFHLLKPSHAALAGGITMATRVEALGTSVLTGTKKKFHNRLLF